MPRAIHRSICLRCHASGVIIVPAFSACRPFRQHLAADLKDRLAGNGADHEQAHPDRRRDHADDDVERGEYVGWDAESRRCCCRIAGGSQPQHKAWRIVWRGLEVGQAEHGWWRLDTQPMMVEDAAPSVAPRDSS